MMINPFDIIQMALDVLLLLGCAVGLPWLCWAVWRIARGY
jgi:Sec-independent protein secretion pathway component TatC